MAVKVSFADLTHTGQVVSANTFPLGIAMVAAYAKEQLGNSIDLEIFRYPENFSDYLKKNTVQIACFSVYCWNIELAHEYARRLKLKSPDVITVFGGDNFPSVAAEQKAFLLHYPGIDFFVEGEGELAFVELFQSLEKVAFRPKDLKRMKTIVPNTRYLEKGNLIAGDLLPRIKNLDIIPSTFDKGLSDKFFDDVLTPMVETTRGCPYSCTFCSDGHRYSNKVSRFSLERVKWEMNYIAERVKVPEFVITDLNFGMFEEDIEVARDLAQIQTSSGWPKYVVIATAKNNKDRIIEISRLLHGALAPGASVQSTDHQVLKYIRRKNLPVRELVEIAKTRAKDNASAMSEVILCLPGDSKKTHFKSIFDMIDADMSLLRNHQFMLLSGTEAASKSARSIFKMETRFRVQPRCFGFYELWGERFSVAEIEEICVGNSTMSYSEYQECRDMDLTVEIFNNDAIFYDLMCFLVNQGCSRTDFIRGVHENILNEEGIVGQLYREYREEETQNLWDTREDLEEFLEDPSVVKDFINGKYGTNEIYKYRTLALFDHIKEIHEVAYGVANSLMNQIGKLNDATEQYLKELFELSIMRKTDLLDTDRRWKHTFHFDFARIVETNFNMDPFEVSIPQGIELEIFFSEQQRDHIGGLIKQYGTTLIGISRVIGRAQIGALYRSVR